MNMWPVKVLGICYVLSIMFGWIYQIKQFFDMYFYLYHTGITCLYTQVHVYMYITCLAWDDKIIVCTSSTISFIDIFVISRFMLDDIMKYFFN